VEKLLSVLSFKSQMWTVAGLKCAENYIPDSVWWNTPWQRSAFQPGKTA